MIQVTITGHDGKAILPQDLASAADLQAVVYQAKNLIRACENIEHAIKNLKHSASKQGGIPYL